MDKPSPNLCMSSEIKPSNNPLEAQTLAVKRAQVEFHNFASLGQPEVVLEDYAQDNVRRGGILRKHLDWIGDLSPFLEIGANAGHSSYLLANEFRADGYALDISADALRHGIYLMEAWGLDRAPIRMAGDAVRLPFADGSLRFVMACQMLSQFMDLDQVFAEVHRVLMPGGVFFFTEEPAKRMLSLRLYRAPYEQQMTPLEKWLHRQGLLGFIVRDVIGADQEESFGIRQNHKLDLKGWHDLVRRHFAEVRYEIFPPRRGWGEAWVHAVGGNAWRTGRLLGATLSGLCRKAGTSPSSAPEADFSARLRCPDCSHRLALDHQQTLCCATCGYRSPLQGGVYNLLKSKDKQDLYPGRRADIIDFSEPGHESQLLSGFYDLEGIFGNKFRWVGPRCRFQLDPVDLVPQSLRLRAHIPEQAIASHGKVSIAIRVNGNLLNELTVTRPGLFVSETPLPAAQSFEIELLTSPTWQAPGDSRSLTITLSMLRLIPTGL